MKTQEELNTIKEEVETLNKKIQELTEEELKQVCGGSGKAPVFKAEKALKEYGKQILDNTAQNTSTILESKKDIEQENKYYGKNTRRIECS